MSCEELDSSTRELLIASRKTGGFEDALSALQSAMADDPNDENKNRVDTLTSALYGLFNGLVTSFWNTKFEFQNEMAYLVRTYLVRFDAIFTLNQDTLLEQHYLDDNIMLGSGGTWSGWQIPGTKLFGPPPLIHDSRLQKTAKRMPDPSAFTTDPRLQPYFKLHGSITFQVDGFRGQLLVLGGHKSAIINQHPLLTWYFRQFVELLARPNTRLVVIGYGFNDLHINGAIADAAAKGNLRVFLVDPRSFGALEGHDPDISKIIGSAVRGVSDRPLSTTFFDDRVEHQKLMRFLA